MNTAFQPAATFQVPAGVASHAGGHDLGGARDEPSAKRLLQQQRNGERSRRPGPNQAHGNQSVGTLWLA